MKKIIILQSDIEAKSDLVDCLLTLFPECDVEVISTDRSASRDLFSESSLS